MHKKKVIFIIESFILGGAERVLVNIANHLDPKEFDITVCSIFKKSVFNNYKAPINIPFEPHIHYKWLVNNNHHWLNILFNYLLCKIPSIFYKILVGDRYDVVVAFYEGAPTHFVGRASLKKGRKIAWLHTSTNLSQKNKSLKEIEQEEIIYDNYSKIIAVSKGVRDSFLRMFPSHTSKMEVIYNPIDSDCIIRQSEEANPQICKPTCPLLVSVGRLTPAKGYDRYLNVLRKLKNDGFHFEAWIIGGGDKTKYEDFCKKHHLENVSFWGNQENPFPFIRMADWIIIPSYIEGLSCVAIESLILGKAVLMTNCVATKELLGENQFGVVVNNDEESLYEGLKTILTNPDIKEKYESATAMFSYFFDYCNGYNHIRRILSGQL